MRQAGYWADVDARARELDRLAYQAGRTLLCRLAACKAEEGEPFVWCNREALRQPLGDLPGRTPFFRFDFANGGGRARDSVAEVVPRQVERFAALQEPAPK